RLNRETLTKNGQVEYAREELVAQIASLMLSAEVGIQPDMDRNAAYVRSWVRDLQNHPLEICKAAQQADRVLNYVMDLERERHPERDPAQADKERAGPEFSPRFAVEYSLAGQKALRESLENPENVHVFQHEGKSLYAVKGTETLYASPSHMPQAGEQFEMQSRVHAFDSEGHMYSVTMREALIRQADGGNEIASPKTPIEIRDTGLTTVFPLDWTGEATVKACAEGRDGNVRSGDIPDAEAEFYSVYAVQASGVEQQVKDFDTREGAQGYADMVTAEYRRQTGREAEVQEPARENRQYINVPYPDRREARALGAQWDGEAKSWYVPPGVEAGALTVKWQPHDPAATRAAQEAKQAERARSGNQDKVYINVPKAEKDAAKELGARWDRNAVSWYVPSGVNPEPLTAKWPAHDPAQAAARAQAALPAVEAERRRSGPEAGETDKADKAERVYLTVPYKEKDAAKAAGARWDGTELRWYAAPGADMEKLAKWRHEDRTVQEPAVTPREEFAAVLKEIGAVVEGEHPIMDKKPHRIEVEGDKAGERSGFYVLHGDGRPAGFCKNNRTQEEIHFAGKGYVLDAAEKKRLQNQALETLAKREAAREKAYNRTADKLQGQLRNLEPPRAPTPYLAAKGVSVHEGVFASGQTTCVPAYNVEGKVRSMQYIQPDGVKRFAKDSRREGCFNPVGGIYGLHKAPALVIAEGYATAASIKEALGHATVAAFDAGNLVPVAQALHRAMPDKPIIIAGDDDKHLEAAGKPNVGREKALEAAAAVGGKAVFPIFASGEREGDPRGFTDFNDLAVKSVLGKEAVKSQIGVVIEMRVEKAAAEKEMAKTHEKGRKQDKGRGRE
ncbi:MAG: DUF5710 domain-containing protein, partial [Planctomycetota bacterium]|nr:DUF5710 domain-containing protein [Planctomycetota bacterium]